MKIEVYDPTKRGDHSVREMTPRLEIRFHLDNGAVIGCRIDDRGALQVQAVNMALSQLIVMPHVSNVVRITAIHGGDL